MPGEGFRCPLRQAPIRRPQAYADSTRVTRGTVDSDTGSDLLYAFSHTVDQISMLARIHLENFGIPVYIQIRDQMLQAIGAGVLAPGEQMPTMRQVAVALKVDLNTVRHAYAELEQAGAIVIRRARGTYVAEQPPPIDGARQTRKARELALQVIGMAKAAGVDPIELSQQIVRFTRDQKESS